MEDNLSITQHIIPNNQVLQLKPVYTPAIANQPAYKPSEYKPPSYMNNNAYMNNNSYMNNNAYMNTYASQPPIKNPLVGALIGLACIIVILIILLICAIMGIFKNYNGSSSSNGGRHSGNNHSGNNHSGNNNQFKNKKSDQNDPSGWQLYTLKGCGHCDKQLEDLKGFNTYVKYERGNPTPIVNNISGELYPREKINGFPLWYNSKTKEVKMGRQQNICNLDPKIKSENC